MKEGLNPENLSDEELVKRTLADQEYFLYIIQRYKEKLFKYILRLTNIDPEDAEDVLQEVFLKTYLNLNDFRPELKFSSWIFRITHNQVINNYRKLKVRAEGNTVSIDDEIVNTLAADLNIEKEVDQMILREKITETLAKMNRKYREILTLKFIEEKNYQEISDILMRPMGTVASMINKAKKEFIKEYGKIYSS